MPPSPSSPKSFRNVFSESAHTSGRPGPTPIQNISVKHRSDTRYFEGASGVTMTNATINNYQGDVIHQRSSSMKEGLRILKEWVSENAMFDSNVGRGARGNCLEGTREKVITTIMDWIEDDSTNSSVLWLHGSVGVGKSAIMQTIAELLFTHQRKQFGGTFFFARDVEGRDKAEYLLSTLAYQLAVNPDLEEVGHHVDAAMANDPILPHKSMDVQAGSLLLQPVIRAMDNNPDNREYPPIFLIDGLDECDTSESQCRTLSDICRAITANQESDLAPIRFLIASRPEYKIQDTFSKSLISSSMVTISLSDPEFDADADVRHYLKEQFSKIFEEKSRLGYMDGVKKPWPSEDTIERFVKESSGQFAYASAIIRFVGRFSDNLSDPVVQLKTLTSSDTAPAYGEALAEIDAFYRHILSSYQRPETLTLVLGGFLMGLHTPEINVYLRVSWNEINTIIDLVASVMRIQDYTYMTDDLEEELGVFQEKYGEPYHPSFKAFLEDKARSGKFFVDYDKLLVLVKTSCQKILSGIVEKEDYSVDTGKFSSGSIKRVVHLLALFPRRIGLCNQPLQSDVRDDFRPFVQALLESLKTKIAAQEKFQRPHRNLCVLLEHLDCLRNLCSYFSYKIWDGGFSKFPVVQRILTSNIYHSVSNNILTAYFETGASLCPFRLHRKRTCGLTCGICHPTLDHLSLMCSPESAKVYLRLNRDILARTTSSDRPPTYSFPAKDIIVHEGLIETAEARVNLRSQHFYAIEQCATFIVESCSTVGKPARYLGWERSIQQLTWFLEHPGISDIKEQDASRQHVLSALCSVIDVGYVLFCHSSQMYWRNHLDYPNLNRQLHLMLWWNNRQFKSESAMKVIRGYDKDLPKRMYDLPRHLFEQTIRVQISHPYFADFWVVDARLSGEDHTPARTVLLKVNPWSMLDRESGKCQWSVEEETKTAMAAPQSFTHAPSHYQIVAIWSALPEDARNQYRALLTEMTLNIWVKVVYGYGVLLADTCCNGNPVVDIHCCYSGFDDAAKIMKLVVEEIALAYDKHPSPKILTALEMIYQIYHDFEPAKRVWLRHKASEVQEKLLSDDFFSLASMTLKKYKGPDAGKYRKMIVYLKREKGPQTLVEKILARLPLF